MLYKSDLRTGMKVTTREGIEYIVLLNVKHECSDDKDIIVGVTDTNNWLRLDSYNNNLTFKDRTMKEFDIVDVKIPHHLANLIADTKSLEWSFQRKEMTQAEIEKILGYKIKIIK